MGGTVDVDVAVLSVVEEEREEVSAVKLSTGSAKALPPLLLPPLTTPPAFASFVVATVFLAISEGQDSRRVRRVRLAECEGTGAAVAAEARDGFAPIAPCHLFVFLISDKREINETNGKCALRDGVGEAYTMAEAFTLEEKKGLD